MPRWLVKGDSMGINIRLSLMIALLLSQQMAPLNGAWPCTIDFKHERSVPAQSYPEKNVTQTDQIDNEAAVQATERDIAQALNALYQLLDVIKALDDPATRSRAYASIAEVIWDYDQLYARKLFRTAFEQTTSPPIPPKPPTPKENDQSHSCARLYTVEQIRYEVLTKLSRLDSNLADELVKSVPIQEEEERKETTAEPRSSELVIEQAFSLLNEDPQKAAALAISTLRAGLSSLFISFMATVRKKSPALADSLFEQALSTVLRNPPPCLHELVSLGCYTHPDIPFTLRRSYGTESVNPAHVTAYLNVLVNVLAWNVQKILNPATTRPSAHDWLCGPWDFFYTLKAIQPYVMQYSPDRSPLVDALTGQLSHILSTKDQQEVDRMLTRQSANTEQRIGDLLQQADKTVKAEERDGLLFQAIYEAVKANQFDKAQDILATLGNSKLKVEVSDYVYYFSAQYAIRNNSLETARRSALALTNPERLILVFISIARQLTQQKQKDAALATLTEAFVRAKQLPASPGKARSLLLISDTLALLDADRTFEALTQAVIAMNEPSGNIECPGQANFEINAKQFGMGYAIAPDNLISTLEQLIHTLAKVDIHRTTFAVASMQKPSVRLTAQIALARAQIEQAREKKAKLSLLRSKAQDPK